MAVMIVMSVQESEAGALLIETVNDVVDNQPIIVHFYSDSLRKIIRKMDGFLLVSAT